MLIKAHLVGIPRSNDDLYQKLIKLMDKIGNNNSDNPQDYKELTDYLDYCRNSNEEYYLQGDLLELGSVDAAERIKAFLKFKGIQNHYTYKEFWLTTFQLPNSIKPEYFILFPLYIRMKDTKVFEQMKVLDFNQETGEITAREVNPDWFIIEKTPISKKKKRSSLLQ